MIRFAIVLAAFLSVSFGQSLPADPLGSMRSTIRESIRSQASAPMRRETPTWPAALCRRICR